MDLSHPEDPDMLVLGFQELDLSTEALLYSTSTVREDAWCHAVFAALGEKAVEYEKVSQTPLDPSAYKLTIFFKISACFQATCRHAHPCCREEVPQGLLQRCDYLRSWRWDPRCHGAPSTTQLTTDSSHSSGGKITGKQRCYCRPLFVYSSSAHSIRRCNSVVYSFTGIHKSHICQRPLGCFR